MPVSITLPLLFVVLWSSAFVTGKIIVIDASPSAALALRFGVVTLGFLAFVIIRREQLWISRRGFFEACVTGVLFHGLYLTGIFHAVLNGVPAGSVALIVCLQPLITGTLAGYLFSEVVTARQWFGLCLGFLGTLFVVDTSIGDFSYSAGLIWAFAGLVAVTSATLLQKKFSGRVPLSTNNFYQAGAATVFHLIIVLTLEPMRLNISTSLVLSIGWQIVAVSFGAFSILMYLLARSSASQTVAWLYLVPPLAAFFSWLILGEELSLTDLLGFLIVSSGVYLATRVPDDAK
ncbi:MAG: DMT family transporter [Gammaproteobacteria bacterium]